MTSKPWVLFALCCFACARYSCAQEGLQSQTAPVAQLQGFVDKHELAGAVTIVADKKQILSVGSVGFADIDAGKAMQPDALFWIASQSKGMTAVAVLMLVDEGKLSLDDPVEKYLPEFKSQMVVAERDANHVLLRKAQLRWPS